MSFNTIGRQREKCEVGNRRLLTRQIGVTLTTVCTLIMMILIVYSPVWFGGRKMSFTNFTYYQAPFSSLGVWIGGPFLSDVADNILPNASLSFNPFNFTLWMPELSIGTTQSVNIYFSPLNYFYLLPFDIAIIAISLCKTAVAFAAMFFFIRQIGYTWRGALFAAVSYALCSVMVVWNGWPHSEVTMYAPILFLLLDKGLKRLRITYIAWFAFVLFLMFMAGMPTYVAYFLYIAGAYTLIYGFLIYRHNVRHLFAYYVGAFAAVALGVLMSLPYTASLLTSVGDNGYASSRSSYAFAALDFGQLSTLMSPYLATNVPIHLNEGTIFAGVLSVITLPFCLVNVRQKPRMLFFAITEIIVGLMVFTGIFDIVFSRLPMVNTSLKYRILVIMLFALSVLVGINMDDLLIPSTRTTQWRIQVTIALAFATGIFGAWTLYYRTHKNRTSGAIAASMTQIVPVTFAISCALMVVLILTAMLRLLSPSSVISTVCTLGLLGCSIADMGITASAYLPLIDRNAPVVPAATSSITFLQRNTNDGEKFVTTGSWTMMPMSYAYYGIRDIRGHGFLFTNPDVSEYYSAIDDQVFKGSPTRPVFQSIQNENLLKYMGVKYVVSVDGQDQKSIDAAETETVHHMNDGLDIRRLDAYSAQIQLTDTVRVMDTRKQVIADMANKYQSDMVYFSKDEGIPTDIYAKQQALAADEHISNVTVNRDGNCEFDVTVNETRYVLVNEYNDGNWEASVDGDSTPVYKANSLFRAVEIPAGTHHVRMTYHNAMIQNLFVVSGITAGLTILGAVISVVFENRYKARKNNSKESTEV